MPIYLGNIEINKETVGSNELGRVYLGSDLVSGGQSFIQATGGRVTSYGDYNNLIVNLKTLQSSSYNQIQNLLVSQSIDINTDYTDFSNFIFFSSAKQRLINFYNKVKDIEDYNTLVSTYTPQTSSKPNLVNDINVATASINGIIANFDGFEYYLYFESGSTLTSSLEYGVNPYPKLNSSKPFILYSTSSATVVNWYNYSIS